MVTSPRASRVAATSFPGRVGERDWLALIPWVAFAAVAAIIGGLLVANGQGLAFFEDDWQFIAQRPFTLEAALVKWGEHWPVIHFIVYRSLFEASGGSYLMLHVAHVGLHIAAAAGLYALLRKEGARWYALGATAIFLIAAPGWENTLWAFQIGFVLGMAFGLWALWVDDARWSALLLTLGIVTAASVVPFLGAALLRALLIRDWRGFAWRVLPAVLYLVWLFVGGSIGERSGGYMAWQPARIMDAPAYIASAIDGLGWGDLRAPLVVSVTLLVLVVAGIVIRPRPLAIAALVALLAYPAFLAITRSEFGPTVALWSRHMYALTPWVLLAAAPLAGTLARCPMGRAFGMTVLTVAVVVNLTGLSATHDTVADRIARDRVNCWYGCH